MSDPKDAIDEIACPIEIFAEADWSDCVGRGVRPCASFGHRFAHGTALASDGRRLLRQIGDQLWALAKSLA
jgi:hypothetical protein